MKTGAILAVLVALVAASPLAAADHVFSHRVYVTGRIIDAQGLPAAGAPVRVEFTGFPSALGLCFDSRDETTGPMGDFTLCRHAHVIPADAAATITVGGTSVTKPLDPALRSAHFHVQLDEARTARDVKGDRDFNSTYRVTGRVFTLLPAPQNQEGVPVNATPNIGDEVIARLVAPDTGHVMGQANATVDEFGAYSVDIPIENLTHGWRVIVSASNDTNSGPLQATMRRSDVHVVLGNELIVGDPPGGSPTPLGAAVALAALLVAAALARRR